MLVNLVSEKYNEVKFEDILRGEVDYGVTHLFDKKNFVMTTKGTEGEKYFYVERSNYVDDKKELSLEFILYNKVLYFLGHNAEVYATIYAHNNDFYDGIDIFEVSKKCNIKTKRFETIFDDFLNQFKEKYVNYVVYGEMNKQEKHSAQYESFMEENINSVKEEQKSDAMKGILKEKDINENIWLSHDKGVDLTNIDIIKFILGEQLIDDLVLMYYEKEYIANERIMFVHLYNEIQKSNQSPEIKSIKRKIDALSKAGKTANILVGDEWIKVNNSLWSGTLMATIGWSSYELKDVKAIKFNGKTLYQE